MAGGGVLVLWCADQVAQTTQPLVDYMGVPVLLGDAVPTWFPKFPEPLLPAPAGGSYRYGDTICDYGSLAASGGEIPDHIRLGLFMHPAGIVVRGACQCGARTEVLCREDASDRFRSPAQRIAIVVETAAGIASALRNTWVQHHQQCGTDGARKIPAHLAVMMVRHCLRASAVLASGQEVPSYMGIVACDPSDSVETTVLTTLDGVPPVCAGAMASGAADPTSRLGIRSATRAEWLATRQYHVRTTPQDFGFDPVAALYVDVKLRYVQLAQDALPSRAAMIQDPNTEWSVTVTAVTHDAGWALTTPWWRQATGTVGVHHPEIVPLSAPCDVLDGMLVRELSAPAHW